MCGLDQERVLSQKQKRRVEGTVGWREPWRGCGFAEGKQARGLLSQAGVGPLLAAQEEMPWCSWGGVVTVSRRCSGGPR